MAEASAPDERQRRICEADRLFEEGIKLVLKDADEAVEKLGKV